MDKKFEEMSFDEIKLYRREELWRSLGMLLVLVIIIVGMVFMEIGHVPFSNRNRFRMIGIAVAIGLMTYLRQLFGVNQVMRNNPEWVKKSGITAKIPLPRNWHIKRTAIIGASILVVLISFFTLYKPQKVNSIPSDVPESVYKLQENIDVPDIVIPDSEESSVQGGNSQ